jgi:hypothetical protein
MAVTRTMPSSFGTARGFAAEGNMAAKRDASHIHSHPMLTIYTRHPGTLIVNLCLNIILSFADANIGVRIATTNPHTGRTKIMVI